MITNIAFNTDGTLTVSRDDGSSVVFSTTAPVVHPTDTEVDILRSDGSTVKLQIPAA